MTPLELAKKAAFEAGDLLLTHLGKVKDVQYKYKNNMVTEADKASEKLLVDIILGEHPTHSIVAEEGSTVENNPKYRWLIDPLDGTTNFLHTYPYFCVSIGYEEEGVMVAGVVYNPVTKEMFTAELGQGAALNGEPIAPSNTGSLKEALVVTGFSHEVPWYVHHNVEYLQSFIYSAQGIRRDGSAALDLSYVASGRSDGFWEIGLHPWDVAAGSLILEEAGGRISGFEGEKFDVYGKELLSSNGLIHDEMLDVFEQTRRQRETKEAQS